MRHATVVGLALTALLMTGRLSAQGPFVYFAGNPANSWYTVGGTCDSPTLTANYLYFISGDVASAGLPARWTAFPFRIHNTITFTHPACPQDCLRSVSGLQARPPILPDILFRT